MSTSSPQLRVAMIGHGFMGAAHSQGWRTAPRFFTLPLAPVMQVLVGRDEASAGQRQTGGDGRSPPRTGVR